jgi:thiol-disulfide isomerase/thioredoxin
MNKKFYLLILVAMVAGLAGGLAGCKGNSFFASSLKASAKPDAQSSGATTGVMEPDVTFESLDGKQVPLSSLKGKVVVVNFWATWCGPCREELPRLRRLAADLEGKGVQFVAVSIDEPKDESKIRPLLEQLHVTPGGNFAVWVGSNQYALQSFGLGGVVPGTVVIGPDGNIVTRIQGEARNADIQSAVGWLLQGRQGTPPPAVVKRY